MKVLHLNTLDHGGAFNAMARLHLALCNLGVESSAAARKSPVAFPEKVLRRFETWLTEGKANIFQPIRSTTRTPVSEMTTLIPDILHLHWVSGWLDLPSFIGSLPPETPVVVTVHDFGIFTGGCHLHSGCEGFAHGCSHCPIVRRPFHNTIPLAARELASKRRSFSGRPLAVVGNSGWTTRYASRSQAFPEGTRFDTVHPSLNASEFTRSTPTEARTHLGLATDQPVLGFGCASLSDENKQLDRFLEASKKIATSFPRLQILLFGEHHALPPAPAGTTIHHLGSLETNADLSRAYSAMDIFCVTSRVETFGQVSVEAQACGTPVAVFDAGGLPETLSPGETGVVSPNGDTSHLAESISALLSNPEKRKEMGTAAPEWVEQQFSAKAAATTYKALYEELLAS